MKCVFLSFGKAIHVLILQFQSRRRAVFAIHGYEHIRSGARARFRASVNRDFILCEKNAGTLFRHYCIEQNRMTQFLKPRTSCVKQVERISQEFPETNISVFKRGNHSAKACFSLPIFCAILRTYLCELQMLGLRIHSLRVRQLEQNRARINNRHPPGKDQIAIKFQQQFRDC